MKIMTQCVCPPIPIRNFDWVAITDDYDGAPDAGPQLAGHGRTEADAIEDLQCQLDDRAIAAERQSGERSEWRCFHCDETFSTIETAREHFGASQDAEPACKIDIAEYRRLEDQQASCRAECCEEAKRYYATQADHAQALIREEQKGYDKGLADGRAALALTYSDLADPNTRNTRLDELAAERQSVDWAETVDAKGNFEWTPELEAARIELCEFWVSVADDLQEGGARNPELGRRAIETEQALTLLGDIVLRASPLPTATDPVAGMSEDLAEAFQDIWGEHCSELGIPPSTWPGPAILTALRTRPNEGTFAGRDVLAERERQKTVEGWTAEHDDMHDKGEIGKAAACYALCGSCADNQRAPMLNLADTYGSEAHSAWRRMWPWNHTWWKPKDRRRDLVRAGALIIAEIERLDRRSLTVPEKKGVGE